jgi:uncharacterized protein YggE
MELFNTPVLPVMSSVSPWKKYTLYAVIFILIIFVYQWISSPMVVTVSGTGSVTAPAETATLVYTLSVNSDSSDRALADVKSLSARTKQILGEMGIPDSSIFESQATVVPASTIVQDASGFQGAIQLGFSTKNLTNLDRITSALYANGAAIVSQPALSVADSDALEKQAFDLAFKNAKQKAWKLSLGNLKFIKKVVLIQESAAQGTSTVTTKADIGTQVQDNISPDDGLIKINKVVLVSYKMW